jgi:hypothetical protein
VTSNFGLYLLAAFANSSFLAAQSVTALWVGAEDCSCDFRSAVSAWLPRRVFRTMRFAIVSADLGAMERASLSAASASGNRPRWSSDTAWATREWGEVDCEVVASSSKT